MVRLLISGVALAALAACQPSAPIVVADAQRDAALAAGPGPSTLPASPPVSSTPLDAGADDPAMRPLPSSVTDAVAGTEAADSAGAAPEAGASRPPPEAVSRTGISAEQDFEAVSETRTIESDAQKIAANRAQYTVIEPTELPTRPGTDQPNIVEYALRTDHPVGARLYRRTSLRSSQRHAEACARFPSPDQAQIEFLERGGPERDRRGLDPDGDGFACSWDPAPFRKARAAANEVEEDNAAADLIDPLAISDE